MLGAVPPYVYVFMAWCYVNHRDSITAPYPICNNAWKRPHLTVMEGSSTWGCSSNARTNSEASRSGFCTPLYSMWLEQYGLCSFHRTERSVVHLSSFTQLYHNTSDSPFRYWERMNQILVRLMTPSQLNRSCMTMIIRNCTHNVQWTRLFRLIKKHRVY
jgi:hypothetical protein